VVDAEAFVEGRDGVDAAVPAEEVDCVRLCGLGVPEGDGVLLPLEPTGDPVRFWAWDGGCCC
jgi:hypothetical protein